MTDPITEDSILTYEKGNIFSNSIMNDIVKLNMNRIEHWDTLAAGIKLNHHFFTSNNFKDRSAELTRWTN